MANTIVENVKVTSGRADRCMIVCRKESNRVALLWDLEQNHDLLRLEKLLALCAQDFVHNPVFPRKEEGVAAWQEDLEQNQDLLSKEKALAVCMILF